MKYIIEEYEKGAMLSEIVSKYNINYSTAKRYLLKNKVSLRTRSESLNMRRNNDCFENIDTEEKAYWLGFIAADGGIDAKKNKLQIGLKGNDYNHLIKFQKFINTSISPKFYKIKYKEEDYEICSIHVISNKLITDLENHNIVQNKSLLYFPNTSLIPFELQKHFWRGYIDGDGHIGVNKKEKPVFNIIGTEETIKIFIDFISNFLNRGKIKSCSKNNSNSNTFQLNLGYRKALTVFELLYKDSKIYLDRKYNLVKLISQNYKKYINNELYNNRSISKQKYIIQVLNVKSNSITNFSTLKNLKLFFNLKGGGGLQKIKQIANTEKIYKENYLIYIKMKDKFKQPEL